MTAASDRGLDLPASRLDGTLRLIVCMGAATCAVPTHPRWWRARLAGPL
ncbi:hypothetical protein [Streptomyces sp. NPDC093099]